MDPPTSLWPRKCCKYASARAYGTLCQTESSRSRRYYACLRANRCRRYLQWMRHWPVGTIAAFSSRAPNAVDPEFNAAIFNAHPGAGNRLRLRQDLRYGYSADRSGRARKANSEQASTQLGHARVDYFNGQKIGMLPLSRQGNYGKLRFCTACRRFMSAAAAFLVRKAPWCLP